MGKILPIHTTTSTLMWLSNLELNKKKLLHIQNCFHKNCTLKSCILFLSAHSESYWLLFSMSFLMSLVIWFPSPQQIRNSKGEAEKRHSDRQSDSWKPDIEGGEKKMIKQAPKYITTWYSNECSQSWPLNHQKKRKDDVMFRDIYVGRQECSS